MCIYNVNGVDPRVKELEDNIRKAIVIPEELKDYLKFSTTSLGGLFLSYYSNGGINNYKENSKMQFSIQICVENSFGKYRGDLVTMEVDRNPKYFKMSGVKKPISSSKIIPKIQKIIDNNKQAMLDYIGLSF